jgi:hypothetical protein
MFESFLRPSGVNPTARVGFPGPGLGLVARIAAFRRFIPSEMRFRAAELIVRRRVATDATDGDSLVGARRRPPLSCLLI